MPKTETRTAPMTRDDCIAVICQLAKSQGFYGRMLESLKELHIYSPETYLEIVMEWEAHEFKDAVEFINWLEG